MAAVNTTQVTFVCEKDTKSGLVKGNKYEVSQDTADVLVKKKLGKIEK